MAPGASSRPSPGKPYGSAWVRFHPPEYAYVSKLRDAFGHRRRLNYERKLLVSKKNVNNLTVRRKDFGLCNLDEDLRPFRSHGIVVVES